MTNSTQLSTYNFESHSIRTIAIKNEPWFVAVDVCNALNIANSRDALLKLDEDEKTTVGLTDSQAGNGAQSLSLVSESGMYTLILRCRDAVKKGSAPHRFRKWVTAEVLPQIRRTGKYQVQPKQIALPEPEKKFTHEFTEHELQQLIWLWFAFKRGVGTFQHIEKAFHALGSNMSGQIYGQAYEYLSVLRSTNQILNRITKEFEIDPMTNWRALEHLRKFDQKAVKIDF
nr:MAG TPA: repressor domain protein [Caudoviricetes sp.]